MGLKAQGPGGFEGKKRNNCLIVLLETGSGAFSETVI